MRLEAPFKRVPALQAQMGDWHYYITALTFEDVAERVQPATGLVTSADMNYWIQRRVIPRRARQIANYLIDQEQHFFPGIVVGVYLGEPTWYAIDLQDNPIFGTPGLDHKSSESLGILELDGTEKLYAIDGQHRVAGINEALRRLRNQEEVEKYDQLANERLLIAFVSADIDKREELERVRRLFTTLNKQAKKVSEPEIVALDEDDVAAIVTRWIAIEYDGLNTRGSVEGEGEHSLLQLGRQHEIRPSNRRSITTIVTLYRMIKRVFQSDIQRIRKKHKDNRPDDDVLESLFEEAMSIWELMRQCDEALNEVLGSNPVQELAYNYRTESGGHILFRPVGLQAFAGALGVLRTRGVENERAVGSLCRLPTEISMPPWENVVWNPRSLGMITAHRTVAEAMFLHMVGQEPRTRGYPLSRRYKELLGDPTGDPLQGVPVYGLE